MMFSTAFLAISKRPAIALATLSMRQSKKSARPADDTTTLSMVMHGAIRTSRTLTGNGVSSSGGGGVDPGAGGDGGAVSLEDVQCEYSCEEASGLSLPEGHSKVDCWEPVTHLRTRRARTEGPLVIHRVRASKACQRASALLYDIATLG